MAFLDDYVFTRGTGKTRTNAAGLIVGVDFSSTSITFGTGSKSFVLTADLNVNRDWVIGSKVIAVSQAAPLGSMEGTVVSYTPSTQTLVLNIAVSNGTGASTNWRLGSLELTRNLLSGGIESHSAATNLVTSSENFAGAGWSRAGAGVGLAPIVTPNAAISPDGSVSASRVVFDLNLGVTTGDQSNLSAVGILNTIGVSTAGSIWVRSATSDDYIMRFDFNGLSSNLANTSSTITVTPQWQEFKIGLLSADTTTRQVFLRLRGGQTITNSNFADVYVWGAQQENGVVQTGPYIPTNGLQVTRAPDSFALTSTAINKIRQGESSLYVEVDTNDIGPVQKRAIRLSGASGDIRLAKRGIGNFSNLNRQLEVENTIYTGANTGNSQFCNGKEMQGVTSINERTGLVSQLGAATSWAWDGADNIQYLLGATEGYLKRDRTVFGTKGLSTLNLNGMQFNGQIGISTCSLSGSVVTTTDGQGYTRVNDPNIPANALDVHTADIGGGIFRTVLVGEEGAISYSDTNGSSWIVNSPALAGVADLNAITFGAGLFVACRGSTANNIQYSADGLNWTLVPGNLGLNAIHWNGTLFVAVGNGGRVQTSSNGVTWTNRTSNVTNQQLAVTFANGLWVAVGTGGSVITSPDGVTWTTRTSGTANNLRAVDFFNGLYIAVGSSQVIRTSPDGVTWTGRTANTTGDLDGIMVIPPSISVPTGRVVVGGSGGALASSDNGTTYTPRSGNNTGLTGVAYGNGTAVYVGGNVNGSALITTVDDSFLYTRRTSGFNGSFTNVRFLQGAFYGCTNSATGVASVYRSVDGVTWAAAGTLTNAGTNDVAFGNGLFVACRASSQVIRSVDGTSFNATAATGLTPSSTLNSIAFAEGIFVVVGTNGVIGTSVDGVTWTQRVSGTTQTLVSVIYSNRDQLWYVTGSTGTFLYSADAITWTPVQDSGYSSIDDSTLQSAMILPQFKTGLNKIAVSYKNNQIITSLNGVSRSDFSGAIPSITSGAIGENLNGYIRKVKIYSEALTEAELNLITGA